ncbi:MAG: ATP-binding protein, partial [Acidimicrobiia bacterium]
MLYGRCEEEIGIPFQPFAEALGHYVAHATTQALAAHVATYGGDLAALTPVLRDRLDGLPQSTGSDHEAQRHLLFASVTAMLTSASATRPMVVVLDDLHWADTSALLLLRHLVRAEGASRLTIIGTYRAGELDRAAALTDTLASLRREPGVERVELDGLADTDVSALMESGAGHDLGDLAGLGQQLRQETGGNPFFVLELLRHLLESGWLFREDGRWRARTDLAALGIPESLREVVGQRIGRLGEQPAALLTTAAVVGRDFDVSFVAALAGVSEEDAIDACDRAVGARLLSEVAPGRYSFAHAVIQYTLYETQGPTRRARTHRRVAEMLEGLLSRGPGPRVGVIARHWLAGRRPEDTATAVDYA